MATVNYAGPVDFAVFVLPDETNVSSSLSALQRQLTAGTFVLLDIEIITLDDAGQPERRAVGDFTSASGGHSLEFAVTDILDNEDLAQIAIEISQNEVALVVVYEDRSLASLAADVDALGGRSLWTGSIPIDVLDEAIDPGNADVERMP